MEQETETETEMMHEERTTKTHTIGIAIRELENDLAHNKAYPRYDGERTDKVRITGGMFAPSLFITKSQCIKWMREHLNSTPSKQGKHWAKDEPKQAKWQLIQSKPREPKRSRMWFDEV